MTRNRLLVIVAAVALVAVAAGLLAARSSGADQQTVVKTAKNAKLHSTILVTLGGRTLYSLSAERNGKFICSDTTCLSLWKPLHVARGARRQVESRVGPGGPDRDGQPAVVAAGKGAPKPSPRPRSRPLP